MLQKCCLVENKAFGALALCVTMTLIFSAAAFQLRVCHTCSQPEKAPKPLVIQTDSFPPAGKSPARPYPLIQGMEAQIPFSVDFYPLLPRGMNVNRASPTLFTLLNGVGPVKAGRIVEERDRNGNFLNRDDFYRRTGLTREKMRYCEEWLTVRD